MKAPEWKIHTLHVGDFTIQHASEGGGSIKNGNLNGDGRLLYIPLKGSCRVNGKKMVSDSVLVCLPNFEYVIAANDAHDWLHLFVPFKVIKQILHKNDISENNLPSGVVHVGKETVSKLKKLLLELFGTAEKAGDLPSNGKVSKEIMAVFELIALQPRVTELMGVGRRLFDRSQIMTLINGKLQSEPLDEIFVADLADVANISGRTLQKIFMEYFGLSPLRYLIIYKMHAARKVLQDSSPSGSTVANIASRFGFWHSGRFASGYRDLFVGRALDTLNNNYKK